MLYNILNFNRTFTDFSPMFYFPLFPCLSSDLSAARGEVCRRFTVCKDKKLIQQKMR